MDWQTIVSLIGSVGFPIVACIYLFRYVKEISAMINNNTTAINELRAMISELLHKE